MVTAQSESESNDGRSWAEYGAVFLSADVQDLIRSRLAGLGVGVGPGSSPADEPGAARSGPSSKKRKQEEGGGAPEPATDASWRICCMDGKDFSVPVPVVPEHVSVFEIRQAISALNEAPCFAIELFRKGAKDALRDEQQLITSHQIPLFMLMKEPSDRLALETLFKSTNGSGWVNKAGWGSGTKLRDWHGVDKIAAGRVTELDLNQNGLSGQIPVCVEYLHNLEVLMLLEDNGLTGPIPAQLGKLQHLSIVAVEKNQLTGGIPPELGSLRALHFLGLSNNSLIGCIPSELGQLAHLQILNLRSNQLTGQIPAELGQLAEVQEITLASNLLTGPIPAELGQLRSLGRLCLQQNQLSGSIPTELGNLGAQLQHFHIFENQLSGCIPVELGQLGGLLVLGLLDNQLTGPIPQELAQLTALTRLGLQNNQLTGQAQFASCMQEHNPGCHLSQ
jgi:Leucine-rich repeat (LRR) protein